MLIGFVINPFAGMGGRLALKGTDGAALQEALEQGATPVAMERAMRALSRMPTDAFFLTASGEMGERLLKDVGFDLEVVHSFDGASTADDTRSTIAQFKGRGVGLVVFCGGDGTARDVMDALGDEVPALGIPSGVKMHSAVFANSPELVGDLVKKFIEGERETRLAEVMDVDEDAFRRGELRARLYGYLRTPVSRDIQPPKGSVFATSDDEQKETIAEYLVEGMLPGVLYVLGPGTTTKAVADRMGQPKTLLGVDVYLDGKLALADANEEDLLRRVSGRNARMVLTPIGRQGFVLGRGNQQLSAKVVNAIGDDNLIIIATPEKLHETPCLRFDSGDPALDERLSSYRKVLVGYGQYRMVRCG